MVGPGWEFDPDMNTAFNYDRLPGSAPVPVSQASKEEDPVPEPYKP
jgi:hypothetical protein